MSEFERGTVADLEFSEGTLLLRGLAPEDVERVFGEGYWLFDRRVGAWRCDACHYREVRRWLSSSGWPLKDRTPLWAPVEWTADRLPELRKDQREASGSWMELRQGMIVMPTGTGKTVVALDIMRRLSVSTLVVSPVRDLMYQWHRRILHDLGYDSGILGDNRYAVRPVTVTTYDSACIHVEALGNRFKLLIFDECHHLPGRLRRDAAIMSAAPYRLGLTATPERSDQRHTDLATLIGPTVYRMDIGDAKGSLLADYQVVRIPIHLTDEEQAEYESLSRIIRSYLYNRRKDQPGYGWEDLCAEVATEPEARRAQAAYYAKKSIEDRAEEKLRVLEDVFRLHAGEPIIIFTGSNAMARDVSTRFLIPCLLSHCRKRERLDILRGLEDGSYPALVANQVLDEGVDLPKVKIAVVIGGMSSERQAKQRLGRILRKHRMKDAILYEVVCVDTSEKLRSRKRRRSDAYAETRHRRF